MSALSERDLLKGEQAHVSKQQRTIKEFQGRIEEHEEELEAERQARAKGNFFFVKLKFQNHNFFREITIIT